METTMKRATVSLPSDILARLSEMAVKSGKTLEKLLDEKERTIKI